MIIIQGLKMGFSANKVRLGLWAERLVESSSPKIVLYLLSRDLIRPLILRQEDAIFPITLV